MGEMQDVRQLAREKLGFEQLRPGQEEAVRAVTEGRDTLVVMTEAMACGTPVIAFPEGSAPELVIDGETGFIVDDEDEMAAAVGRLGEIDPARCRELARERFDVAAVAAAYEQVYETVVATSKPASSRAG